MKKRAKLRIGIFLTAAFLVVFIWGLTSSVRASRLDSRVRAVRQRALCELCGYMSGIETDLNKSLYCGSARTLGTLASELGRLTAGAKESLAVLSSGEEPLENTYKFLSQAGEYTASLSRAAAAGEEITDAKRDTVKKLLRCASSLSARFDRMVTLMNDNCFSFEDAGKLLDGAEQSSETVVSYIDAACGAEESLTDFPTLIYDGPFSDNMQNRESALLKKSERVAREDARKKAAELIGVEEKLLIDDPSRTGKLAAYNFRYDKTAVSVSLRGGYPVYILTESTVGEAVISEREAIGKALDFLDLCGYPGMMSTYYFTHDGICTVNFAYMEGDAVCYPDLIKVSVALDDGRITGMDASDFLMNHVERKLPEPLITEEEAKNSAAGNLRVKNTALAVIPSGGGEEYYTYELTCEADDGETVLVYKDVLTGEEDDILILLFTDHGTLTK